MRYLYSESKQLYRAYTLSNDEAIQAFLDAFSLSPIETNTLIKAEEAHSETEGNLIETYLMKFEGDFPSTQIMALSAEEIDRILNGEDIAFSPDEAIVRWVDTEYRLFRRIEDYHYAYVTLEPAKSLDDFVKTGLEITNRRKSRAGKSLAPNNQRSRTHKDETSLHPPTGSFPKPARTDA